jgi:hypothetical protein
MKEGKKKFCYFYCDLTARKWKSGKNQKIKNFFTTLNHYHHHQLSSNFFGSKPLERIKDL